MTRRKLIYFTRSQSNIAQVIDNFMSFLFVKWRLRSLETTTSPDQGRNNASQLKLNLKDGTTKNGKKNARNANRRKVIKNPTSGKSETFSKTNELNQLQQKHIPDRKKTKTAFNETNDVDKGKAQRQVSINDERGSSHHHANNVL